MKRIFYLLLLVPAFMLLATTANTRQHSHALVQEAVAYPSERAMKEAERLLKTNARMPHVYEGEGNRHCIYCGVWEPYGYFNKECPALLRAAVDRLLVGK